MRTETRRVCRRLAGLAAGLLAAAGCGGGTAGVSGVVTLDGAPLDGASVTYAPVGGGDVGGSSGRTDAQGRYVLRTVSGDRAGAAVGKHRVAVSLFRGDPRNPDVGGKELVPLRYNHKTELTFDVPAGGTDRADFDLKSK